MPNPIEVAMAASAALSELQESGTVGYSETKTVLQMVCHADAADTTMYNIGDFVPEVGKTYKVTVDGVTTTNTAVSIVADGAEYVILGNLGNLSLGDDTGEDWLIASTSGIKALIHKTKLYPETIALTIKTETIHPIAEKYLPGVCLPVVELTTVATTSPTLLTAEESSMMDALGGMPAVIKAMTDNMVKFRCVFNALKTDTITVYSTSIGALEAQILWNTGKWTIMYTDTSA